MALDMPVAYECNHTEDSDIKRVVALQQQLLVIQERVMKKMASTLDEDAIINAIALIAYEATFVSGDELFREQVASHVHKMLTNIMSNCDDKNISEGFLFVLPLVTKPFYLFCLKRQYYMDTAQENFGEHFARVKLLNEVDRTSEHLDFIVNFMEGKFGSTSQEGVMNMISFFSYMSLLKDSDISDENMEAIIAFAIDVMDTEDSDKDDLFMIIKRCYAHI